MVLGDAIVYQLRVLYTLGKVDMGWDSAPGLGA